MQTRTLHMRCQVPNRDAEFWRALILCGQRRICTCASAKTEAFRAVGSVQELRAPRWSHPFDGRSCLARRRDGGVSSATFGDWQVLGTQYTFGSAIVESVTGIAEYVD
jgi:hypothetical protein